MRTSDADREKRTQRVAFVIIGISLAVVGFSLMIAVGPAFIGLMGAGVVFLVLGLGNLLEEDRP